MKVTAEATRVARGWAVSVPEVPVYTQARRLDQVAMMAADAVGTLEGIPHADIEVEVRVQLPEALQADLDRAKRARQEASDLEREASAGFIEVARELAREGLTLREVGSILGVSYQRAGQLVGVRAMRRAGGGDVTVTLNPDT